MATPTSDAQENDLQYGSADNITRLRVSSLPSSGLTTPEYNHEVKMEKTRGSVVSNDIGFHREVHNRLRSHFTCSTDRVKKVLFSTLPILSWLPKYEVRENIVSDLIAGVTVGIMHIPQGMSYALLATLPPIYGLYSAFFPVIIYAFLGTSRHISIGVMAVLSIMVGATIERLLPEGAGQLPADLYNSSISNTTLEELQYQAQQTEVQERLYIAGAVTLMSGILQVAMGLLQLGFITIYLSDPLVSAFTTSAAFHVVNSQIKHLFGLEIPRYSGPLSIVYTVIAIFSRITETNIATLVTSIISVIVLVVLKELNLKYKDKLKGIPIPSELIVLILGTIISHFATLEERYSVKVVGVIPTGLPKPTVPRVSLLGQVAPDCVAMSLVSFSYSLAIAKLFSKKYAYKIDANQELLAYGTSNLFGSFFSCFVCSTAISRTLVGEAAGTKTQLMSLVQCVVMLLVLLFIGPLFRSTQTAVLAVIVVVNVKNMFKQFAELKPLWKISKIDFVIWWVTFLAVFLLGLDIGLGTGMAFSLLTVLFRSQRPATTLLGQVPNCDIYRDLHNYKAAQEIPSVKIFRFDMSLFFSNCDHFKTSLYSQTGLDPVVLLAQRKKADDEKKKLEKKRAKEAKKVSENGKEMVELDGFISMEVEEPPVPEVKTVILDCGPFNFLDSVAVNTLTQVHKDYKSVGVRFLLAHCKANIRDQLVSCGFFEKIECDNLFISVHDAVLFSLAEDAKVEAKEEEPQEDGEAADTTHIEMESEI
ncbi:prestin-like isoform X1 [Branchiostoma floridae x Branchiostoma japonicum]